MKNVLKAAVAACGLVACGGPMEDADFEAGAAELKNPHHYVTPKNFGQQPVPELGRSLDPQAVAGGLIGSQVVKPPDVHGFLRPSLNMDQSVLPPKSGEGFSGLQGQAPMGSELGDPTDPRNHYGAAIYLQDKPAEEQRGLYKTDAANCTDKSKCLTAEQQAQEELALLKALLGIP